MVATFLNHSVPISDAMGYKEGDRFLQAIDGAWTGKPNRDLPIPVALQNGIDDRHQIRQLAQHYYPFSVGGATNPGLPDMQRLLFNHTQNTGALDFLPAWLDYFSTFADGQRLPFLWGEITSALGNEPGFQNSFGNSLWNLDTFLYSMVLGVDSMQYSENIASYFLLWLPQPQGDQPAATGACFYFIPLLADFIGNSTKSQAVELDYDLGTENTNIVAYAAYENDTPKRVALINLDFWGSYEISGNVTIGNPGGGKVVRNTTTALPGPSPRNVEPVTIQVPDWCTSVEVTRMSSPVSLQISDYCL